MPPCARYASPSGAICTGNFPGNLLAVSRRRTDLRYLREISASWTRFRLARVGGTSERFERRRFFYSPNVYPLWMTCYLFMML